MQGNRAGCVWGALGGAGAGLIIGMYFLLAGPPDAGNPLFRPPVYGILMTPMLLFALLGVFVGIIVQLARGR
jgi:hypothetical protein